MCVSAQASFIVGAGTGVVGLAALKRASPTPRRWLALVPCFFAIQQVSEGVVWLHLTGQFNVTPVTKAAQYIYLTFALVFWPVYAPFAVTIAEQIRFRRRLCKFAAMGGALVSLYNLNQLVGIEQSPTVLGHSIRYGYGEAYLPERFAYGVAAMMPLFISSLRKMWVLGVLAMLGFGVADYFFYTVFTSVWCFFTAILSVSLYFILRDNENRQRRD